MSRRLRSFASAATGTVSAAAILLASVILVATWWTAWSDAPREKAAVEALKERGKRDAAVQPELQAELDRQREAAARRRKVYDRGALVALAAGAAFVAWRRRPGLAQERASARRGGGARPIETAPLSAAADAAGAAGRTKGQGPAAAHRPREGCSAACGGSHRAAGEPGKDEAAPIDLAPVEEIVRREGTGPQACIPILQAIQARYRYLPSAAIRRVVELTSISPSQIAGVSTFYGQFRHRPVGEHVLRVCEGTACHVAGAGEVAEELRRAAGIAPGSDTDPTRRFTLERVACVGSCSLAPVVTVDDRMHGHLSPLAAAALVEGVAAADAKPSRNGVRRRSVAGGSNGRHAGGEPGIEIRVGLGSCGIASGALPVLEAIQDEARAAGGGALVKAVGCSGLCHREPLVEVLQGGERRALYGNLDAGAARQIAARWVRPRGLAGRARRGVAGARRRLLEDAAWTSAEERRFDPGPYLARQVRIVLENCGEVDPSSLEEYRARGGFRALDRCLHERTPEEVIAAVKESGLRGRGGAGFPSATKWEVARRAPGSPKYVIANGDEGDPGAFMDRAVMEGDPFRVVEGLAIAAYAIGATEGFLYVRREYPVAVRNLRAAIERAAEAGLLGDRVLGTAFSLHLTLREGAGAFVCGEETALIRSIEGWRGMPRLRPPFPAVEGLFGKPTVINNVETLACLPWILRNGPGVFASLGTERSRGTKVFSLAGKVRRGGLIEVPMGITIREIVEEVGGGVPEGRRFKAVLIGGPSGGCIPASLADTRIDYDELTRTGAIMGSGGLVVLDDRDCAVDIARYFLKFTQSESCGKCTYCRIGTKRMLEVLDRICGGRGRPADLATLDELADRVKRGSLCGLGQTAPNPVLTTLRYFRDEYVAHVNGRCPAGRCKPLIHYTVKESCTGCTLCAQVCPVAAIEMRPYERHEVMQDRCTKCGLCLAACPEESILVA